MQIRYPVDIDQFDTEASNLNRLHRNATAMSGEFTLEDAKYILNELERRVGTLNGTGAGDNHEKRLDGVEATLTGVVQTGGVIYYSGIYPKMKYPNTSLDAGYESARKLVVNKGIDITPDAVSGYGNLNLFFNRNLGPVSGIANINWAEYISFGPNAGKYIKRYSLGNDIAQPQVVSATGDTVNPLFILFNMTDVDLNDGTSYDMVYIQTYENIVGGGTLYPGQWGFNAAPSHGSCFSFAPFKSHQPNTLYVLELNDDNAGNPYLRFTRGATGYNRMTVDNVGTFRWYRDSDGGHDPDAGIGYVMQFLGADRSELQLKGKSFGAIATTGGITVAGMDTLFVAFQTAGYATGDKSVFLTTVPSGTGVSFFRAYTGALIVGTESAEKLYLSTNNTDRLVITETGDIGIGLDAPLYKIHHKKTGADCRALLETDKDNYAMCGFYDGEDTWWIGKENDADPNFEVWYNSSLLLALTVGGDMSITGEMNVGSGKVYKVNGTQVVTSRQSAITDPTGGGTVDAEARTAIGSILTALRTHGLIQT